MNTLIRTDEFSTWLKALKDPTGKARILSRLDSAALGNFGDCKSLGGGVSEMRVDSGPGYRVYYCQRGRFIYLLLLGGSKSSQQRDIKRAKRMAQEVQ